MSTIEKRIILCGDFNVCLDRTDTYYGSRSNIDKLAACRPSERNAMRRAVEGMVNNKVEGYTWWQERFNPGHNKTLGIGLRLDYVFTSFNTIESGKIDETVSDHCPVYIDFL